MTTDGLLLGGVGRYTDPWHPFDETAAAIVAVAAEADVQLRMPDDVDQALTDLRTGPLPAVVVVDLGLPTDDGPVPANDDALVGLHRLLDSAVPILAVHVAATVFPDDPAWEAALGGTWVRGTTMHPEFGPVRVRVTDAAHPLTAGLGDFTLEDERYTYLRVDGAVRVLLGHDHEGVRHPLLWVHERGSGGTTVYDALGHDARSFASPEHREVLRRAMRFLVRAP